MPPNDLEPDVTSRSYFPPVYGHYSKILSNKTPIATNKGTPSRGFRLRGDVFQVPGRLLLTHKASTQQVNLTINLFTFQLAELRQECEARSLDAKGNKGELIARLQTYLDEHGM